jgi:hypothetical protein
LAKVGNPPLATFRELLAHKAFILCRKLYLLIRMIAHAWIAPKGFVKLTKSNGYSIVAKMQHPISSRTSLKLLLAVGLPL